MKYAVAHMNFYDNDLQIKIVTGDSWRDALIKAFPKMKWLKSNDLEDAREEAFNSDMLFAVEEIT